MNARIKKLRKALDLTQQDFADRLGTTRNNIAGYETGRRAPSVAVISLICREFNVSENWLRTGEGEMFVQQTEADELAAAVNRLMSGESAGFKRRLINVLSTLKDEQWYVLQEKLEEIAGMRDIPPMPTFSPQINPTPSATAEAEALYENSLGYAQNTSSSASSTAKGTESTGKAMLA